MSMNAWGQFNNAGVSLVTIPDGDAGTREVLKTMRDSVRRGKQDARLRHVAQTVVANVPAKNWRGEILAVFNFVKASVRYSLDIHQIEVVQDPAVTLQLGYGDCDDICVLLACLLECIGHPCVLCAIGFDTPPDGYSHVVVLTSGAGETELISLDATESHPAGWFPPNPTTIMLAPIESGGGL